MARRCYGYGKWDAPYWFIGPGQGKGPEEINNNQERLAAWIRMGRPEVCDCCCFHREIGEDSWHKENPRLQSTWKSLIRLLMAFRGWHPTNDARRVYQRDQWGGSNGETCVIELPGLAARNLNSPADRQCYREHRIATIRKRLQEQKRPPTLVAMYGKGDHSSWEEIAGRTLELNVPASTDVTVFIPVLHPNTHGLTNQYWIDVGQQLRQTSHSSNI